MNLLVKNFSTFPNFAIQPPQLTYRRNNSPKTDKHNETPEKRKLHLLPFILHTTTTTHMVYHPPATAITVHMIYPNRKHHCRVAGTSLHFHTRETGVHAWKSGAFWRSPTDLKGVGWRRVGSGCCVCVMHHGYLFYFCKADSIKIVGRD